MYPNFKRTRGEDKSPRKHQVKPDRELTVSSVAYNRKYVPAMRICGLWLEDYGFHQGDKISVHCENGKLTITKLED